MLLTPPNGKQCPEQKRQIVHEHQMPMAMINQRSGKQIQKPTDKGNPFRKMLPAKPIAQHTAPPNQQDTATLNVVHHRHKRQQVRKQKNRIE